MNKRSIVALISAAVLSGLGAANTDSVRSWGKWGQLYTAAGQPTLSLPLNISFNNAPNPIDSSQFVTTVENNIQVYGVYTDWNSIDEIFRFDYRTQPLSGITLTETNSTASFTGINENNQTAIKLENLPLNQSDQWQDISYRLYERLTDSEASYTEQYLWLVSDSAHFVGYADHYVEFDYDEDNESELFELSTYSTFVGGTTTGLDQLQRLAGITQAQYSGYFLHHGGHVTIDVNFTDSSWGGTFQTYTKGMGDLTVTNGTIKGAQLSASLNNITSDELSLSAGSVNASFFGENANNIGGIVDATNEIGRYVDVFDAAKDDGNVLGGI